MSSTDPCVRRRLARRGNTTTAQPEAVVAAAVSAALVIAVPLSIRVHRVRYQEHHLEAECFVLPPSTRMTDGAPISPLATKTWAKTISIMLR